MNPTTPEPAKPITPQPEGGVGYIPAQPETPQTTAPAPSGPSLSSQIPGLTVGGAPAATNASPSNPAPTPTPSSTPEPTPTAGQPGYGNGASYGSGAPSVQGGSFNVDPSSTNSAPRFGTPTVSKGGRRLGKKSLLLVVMLFVLLVGGGAAAYFGYVVPNKPENIWKTAMANTIKGYDKLTEYATTAKDSKSVKMDGSFKLSGPAAMNGTITGQGDDTNAEAKLKFSTTGIDITADAKMIQASDNDKMVDVYFKVDGLSGVSSLLGNNPEVTKVINTINNQWYVIDHELLEQYAGQADPTKQFSQEDLNTLLKEVGETNKNHLFTSDAQKSALVVKKNVGKETKDGRSTYHYKVGFHKENTKTYVAAICDDIKKNLIEKLPSGSAQSTAFNCEQISKSVEVDSEETADVWVDMGTKLISAIRISDKADSTNNYVELVQNYTGGDEFPFGLKINNKSGDVITAGSMIVSVNMKTDEVKVNGDIKVSGSNSLDGSLDMTVTPSDEEVKITKPSGAKSISQLFKDLGLPDLTTSLPMASPALSNPSNSPASVLQ